MILPAVPTTLTVVMSRGHSRDPEKRALEGAIVEAATKLAGVAVLDLPHLYDLKASDESIRTLQSTEGDLVVLTWLFPRAAHWLLDRLQVRGQVGETAFDPEPDDDDEAEAEVAEDREPRVAEIFPRTGRTIYCLDMRNVDAAKLTAEVVRIAEVSLRKAESESTVDPFKVEGRLSVDGPLKIDGPWAAAESVSQPLRLEETITRRWYPVIDYSRCTNCMECIDFCLFGVYGVDGAETILVEQPDNCRKGCPACSRVCPANAIIFPQHKAPAIAGAPVEDGQDGFKIDLSVLFGAPDKTADPVAIAARERDEQLLLAGRQAVGLPTTRARQKATSEPDHLDTLIDQLDRAEI